MRGHPLLGLPRLEIQRLADAPDLAGRNGDAVLVEPPGSKRCRLLASAAVSALPAVARGAAAEALPTSRRNVRARAVLAATEAGIAVAAAILLLAWSRGIDVNPLDRVGQVSGLAAVQLRFAVLVLVLIGVATAATRRWPERRNLVLRLSCGALAGLATAVTAAGVAVALSGTPWPLFANGGDAGVLSAWASAVRAGVGVPLDYPPAFVHVLAGYSALIDQDPSYALKHLQIVGTALIGPTSYCAWRLLLSPVHALALGVVAALPFVDAYKPATYMVLIVLLPVLSFLGKALRQSPGWTWRRCAVVGAVFGVVLGVLFLSYSGWFVWSAPGALVAMLLLFPWRESAGRGLVLLATSAAVFAVVSAVHLIPLLRGAGSVKDAYFYFDVLVEPAYVAMWRNDFAGGVTAWPPPGELGGVGVFTVVLVMGLGAALWMGARHAVVVVTACVLASAWVIRFIVAAAMHETGTVQLWPRTTMQILYCLVVLTGYALLLGLSSVRSFAADRHMEPGVDPAGSSGRSRPAVPAVAVLGAAALLFASAGSAAADRYMPRKDDSTGYLAWVSHTTPTLTGDCPSRAPAGECR